MTRGKGRGNTTRASKTSIRGQGSTSRVYMPTVPIPITNSQQGGINSSTAPDHINQFQTLAPTSSPPVQTSIFWNLQILALPGYVSLSRVNVNPNGINWKSVSHEIKDIYLGEFEKEFYWDPSIDSEVKILWRKKAARRYSDFISCIKKEAVRPKYVIENSKINSRNRSGGQNAVAKGTHTGGSITIGEHRKRLAIAKGRDPTPSELHLHVHTHGHDGKSFVGEKKRRICGLGSQAKLFYWKNFCASASGSDVSSSIPCTNAQTTTEKLDDFITRLIPSLTDHMLPILVERVRGLISSTSSQPNTPMTPVIPTPTNIDEANASISEEDCGSPISLS
ncbi:hypothetical protein R3W88_019322 [Solanum pinnatisectum]|uniref:Uncharacterized protein n=1 Tax=Solanum pinnatisectum TaxID=50273 RepID=A0AAV9KLC5_9SOLN|nr:hypothetical protein R3W88_019322 [Solanum pinnatisectum]